MINEYVRCSYQERWREVPYEARQPSIDFSIEMVPIHAKRLLWEMRERINFQLCLSAHVQKGFFIAKKYISVGFFKT